ncbi:hypothetical protein RKE29_05785 [Streptomyces sp. B1866]|uniref:hypothetical protein n=1 Tax=Streptomyces sp. B1866 TaxID=3075431 RepID=UPI0028916A86|nr:hypothetical protein [Streptomyces sp. B1866]MDT3396155.1 hypothetical protein [Streptomyces sp. B1866]
MGFLPFSPRATHHVDQAQAALRDGDTDGAAAEISQIIQHGTPEDLDRVEAALAEAHRRLRDSR